MHIVYHGVRSRSDIKLAYEIGFQGVGLFSDSQNSIGDVRSLVQSVPAFMSTFLTTMSSSYEEIYEQARQTECQNICVLEDVENSTLQRLKSNPLNFKILKQYNLLRLQQSGIYRSKANLSPSDAMIVNFFDFDPHMLVPRINLTLISEIVSMASRPVIFAGFHTVAQAEFVLTRVRPYGVVMGKEVFAKSSVTAREAYTALTRAFFQFKKGITQRSNYVTPSERAPISNNFAPRSRSVHTQGTQDSIHPHRQSHSPNNTRALDSRSNGAGSFNGKSFLNQTFDSTADQALVLKESFANPILPSHTSPARNLEDGKTSPDSSYDST